MKRPSDQSQDVRTLYHKVTSARVAGGAAGGATPRAHPSERRAHPAKTAIHWLSSTHEWQVRPRAKTSFRIIDSKNTLSTTHHRHLLLHHHYQITKTVTHI